MFVKPDGGTGYWANWNDKKTRSPFGLGWECRRNNHPKSENPYNRETEFGRWRQFMEGFDSYKCKDAEINENYGIDNGAVV
jgi:hypothetical protein